MKKLLQTPYALIAFIALGLLIAFSLVTSRSPAERADVTMPSKPVEIIHVARIPFQARVTAYGNAEPVVTLKTLAEVSGKVSYIHPDLEQGISIPAGTVVLRIDSEDYEVSLKQTQADLSGNQSTLKQLLEEEKTTRRSLELAKRNLEVGEKELERIRSVWERKLVARSALDAEQQKVIQLNQQVEELQGQLNTFASRKANVKAQITRAEQQVKGQQTTLGRTEITLPFNSRIGEVAVEKGQYVNVGTILFEALDMKGVEVNAQLPIIHLRSLVAHLDSKVLDQPLVGNYRKIINQLGLKARVRLVGGLPEALWDAKVLRMSESVDPTRRTMGVVVGVERPYEKIIPGKRPPLVKGMHTAVQLYAPTREAIVIPRKAIHHGRVYLVNQQQQLEIRPIRIQQQQGELVVVIEGLEEGERLIVNDLVPVIEGMPLQPLRMIDYENTLRKRAAGDARA